MSSVAGVLGRFIAFLWRNDPGLCGAGPSAKNLSRTRASDLLLPLLIAWPLILALPVTALGSVENFAARYQAYRSAANDATAALSKKDYQTAVEQFSKAIEMSPFVVSHYQDRGVAYYRKGEEKKAIEDFDKVIVLDPRSSSAFAYRGLCRVKGGDYQGALSDYRKGLELNPRDPTIHNNLAWLYATATDEKVQDKLKALEHAARAAELSNERNAEVLDTLARVYFINGKAKEAVEALSKALRLEPDNERFKETLGRYQEGTKKD